MNIEMKLVWTEEDTNDFCKLDSLVSDKLYESGFDLYSKVSTDMYFIKIIDDGEVLGGLLARSEGAWLKIDQLWVDSIIRGQGFATKMLKYLEDNASLKKLEYIHVESIENYGAEFYLARGFEVYATLNNCPIEPYKKLLLKKNIKQ